MEPELIYLAYLFFDAAHLARMPGQQLVI